MKLEITEPQAVDQVFIFVFLLTGVVSVKLRRRVDRHFAERAVKEAPGFLLLCLRVGLRLSFGLVVCVRF